MLGGQGWYLALAYAHVVISLGCNELAHAATASRTFQTNRSLRSSVPDRRRHGRSGHLQAGHRLPQRGRQEHTGPGDSAKGQKALSQPGLQGPSITDSLPI